MPNKAIYAGSFDPITYGHIDLIKRALKIFDKVVVAVADNTSKEELFTIKERVALIKKSTADLKKVEVDSFKGLAVDYVKSRGSRTIIRGIRMLSDFEYEFQMALTNRQLSKDVETMFLMPNESYSYLSSKLIKEAVSLGANVGSFVPPSVEKALRKKLLKK
ncbi:MAG: pantetheine-phosphate adenylyltransferase [Candidatus Omnitrophica bacterium]|nr:pantetheine-phosphate adenylyltransferase [Candidatus Omnitrophota bacterium]